MFSNITLKNINAVLAFSALFESQNAKLAQVEIETSYLAPYSYFKDICSFIKTLYEENFIICFDWVDWQKEAKSLIDNPSLLNLADISTIQKLLTTHVRQERFSSGHLVKMIDNGHILAIMKRMAVIKIDMLMRNTN